MSYIAPQSGLKSYTCPHCGVVARQYHWINAGLLDQSQFPEFSQNPVRVSKCEHCGEICLWYFDKLVYPNRGNAPLPNPDMPIEVKKEYDEAALILTNSPRGAAALLRLAIQKLCIYLGGTGENANDDIAALVKKGLPVTVQQALDIVRVTGNNAVHPGQINTDDVEIVVNLFPLVNIIVVYMISIPNKINGLYSNLPESAKSAIEKRDIKKVKARPT